MIENQIKTQNRARSALAKKAIEMQANWFDSLIIIRHRDIEISFMHQISRNDHDLLVWQKMDVGEDYSFKRPYTRHQVLRNSSIREGVTDLRTDRRTDPLTEVLRRT